MTRRLPALLLLACLSSCSLLRGSAARGLYIRKDYAGRIERAAVLPETVETDAGADSARVKRNAEYIASLLLRLRNDLLEAPSGRLRARIELKETSFLRGFEPVNTVTAEIALYEEGSAEAAVLFLFSEDTRESLSSYAYLYRFLHNAIGGLR